MVKSSLYQHLDVDWGAEMLLLFGGDDRESRQVGCLVKVFQIWLFLKTVFFDNIQNPLCQRVKSKLKFTEIESQTESI